MDRRQIIKNTGLAGILATGVAPGIVGAQAQIRWRMTSSFPKNLDTLFGVADVFSKKVSEMTGGKFVISTHAPGELVPAFGTIDAVQQGTVECAGTASYYYFGKDPVFTLGCTIPFGLNARQMTAWLYEGNGLTLMRDFFRQYNIMMFPMGNTGSQMGGWWRKEIKSVADIKGVKFRCGGFPGKVWDRLGGIAVNIPGPEIYSALEKGTVDAAEWVGPYDDERLGLHKVASHYAYPGWWEPGPNIDLHVNIKAYEALSSEYRAIVESAAAYAHTDMLAKYDTRNPAALIRLVAGGTKLYKFPQDTMDAAFKEAMSLYSELSDTNPTWKKIYTDLSNFRRSANIWFRRTEAANDDFMQAAKL